MDILALDAIGQLGALAKGQISARELLQAAVDRADSTAKSLNAVVVRDLDRAIATARNSMNVAHAARRSADSPVYP